MALGTPIGGGGGGVSFGTPIGRGAGQFSTPHVKKRDLAALLQDVEDMVAGLINSPVAITKAAYHTGEHLGGRNLEAPGLGDIGKGIAASYEDMYSPLLHGQGGKFLEKLREHPLQPILDVATLATLGGAGVGKLGQAAAKAGAGETTLTKLAGYTAATPEATSAARAAGLHAGELAATPGLVPKAQLLGTNTVAEGQQLGRVLPRNPVVRARKEAVGKVLGAAGEKIPLGPLSEASRDSRAFRREYDRRRAQLFRLLPGAQRAVGKLDARDKVAFEFVAQGIDPEHMLNNVWKPQLERLGAKDPNRATLTAKIHEIENTPGLVDAVRNPSDKLRFAVQHARNVTTHQQERAIALGLLDPEAVTERAYGPLRVQHGAEHRVIDVEDVRDPELVDRLKREHEAAQRAHAAAADRFARHEAQSAAAREAAAKRMPDLEGWLGKVAHDPFGDELAGLVRQHVHPKVASLIEKLLALADPKRGGTPAEAANALNRAQQMMARQLTVAADKLRAEVEKDIAAAETHAKRAGREHEQAASASETAAEEARRKLADAESDIVVTQREEAVGGRSTEEIRAERQAAGLEEPIYFPHLTPRGKRGKGPVGKSSQDILNRPKRKLDEQRRSEMFNFIHGRYRRDPEAMFETSTRILRMVDVGERFNHMLRLSLTVPKHEALDARMVVMNDAQIKNLARKWDEAGTLLTSVKDIVGDDPAFEALRTQYLDSLKLAGAHVPEGMVRAVPKELYRAMVGDLDQIGVFARKFDKITDFWRAIVLPLRPAWIVNNAVGNYLLLALADNPWLALKNIPRAQMLLRGERAGLDAVRKLGKTSEYNRVLLEQLHERLPDIIASGQVRTETVGAAGALRGTGSDAAASLRQAGNKAVRAGVKGVDVATEFNAVLTDDMPRVVRYLTLMDQHVAKARTAVEFKGMTDAQIAESLLSQDAFASRISRQVMGDLLDYGSLTKAERTYARRLIPFYAWNKLITQYTIRQLLDRPAILLGMQQASHVGLEDTKRELGDVPRFLRGAIPLGNGKVLTTGGLNPFATPATVARVVASLAGSGQSLFGPDTVGSQLGPIPGGLAEALTGKEIMGGPVRLPFSRLLTDNPEGVPVPIAARPFTQFFGNLPIAGLAERGAESAGNVDPRQESIYQPGFLQYLESYMGLPYRQINPQVAQQRARSEEYRQGRPAPTLGLYGS